MLPIDDGNRGTPNARRPPMHLSDQEAANLEFIDC
jgi:hypothetical protein